MSYALSQIHGLYSNDKRTAADINEHLSHNCTERVVHRRVDEHSPLHGMSI